MALKSTELTPGAQVTGCVGSGHPVTVIPAQWIGGNALRLTYRTLDSWLDERILYRDHEPRLRTGLSLSSMGSLYVVDRLS